MVAFGFKIDERYLADKSNDHNDSIEGHLKVIKFSLLK